MGIERNKGEKIGIYNYNKKSEKKKQKETEKELDLGKPVN